MTFSQSRSCRILNYSRILSLILSFVTGVTFTVGGIWLVSLHGSPYYLIAGVAYLLLTVLVARKKPVAIGLSWITFILTVIWALQEVGLSYWGLMPRLFLPLILFLVTIVASLSFGRLKAGTRQLSIVTSCVFAIVSVVFFGLAFKPHGAVENLTGEIPIDEALYQANNGQSSDDWSFFGRKSTGTRFAPYEQITKDNVTDLRVAWTYHTGRQLKTQGNNVAGVDENTPLQVGNVLYACTPQSVVHAIDADSGKPIWTFDPKAEATEHVTCRSVGFYDAAKDTTLPDNERNSALAHGQCARRIIVTSVDARMFAVDASSGKACEDFGKAGIVDLKIGMGDTENGVLYHPTASPVVMGHQVIIGGWSRDLSASAISGVVRSFDVITGKQLWAWDAGRNIVGEGRPDAYQNGTPNTWAVPAFDQQLNLVYLATGNGPPDYWGGNRTHENDTYTDAIVAVDANTGETRWHFETVHHDLWDYDLPSQPVIYNLPDGKGSTVPALIQTTKTGQVFILDRRTGTPLSQVKEIPVESTVAAQGDFASPTQPYSVDMPQFANERLHESSMWGMTAFDQLYCRIQFQKIDYRGMYTPPSDKPYLQWPGLFGGMNWGGVSIDEKRGLMFINDIRIPIQMQLVSREDAKKETLSPGETPGFFGKARPQDAGPYGAVKVSYFQSPLGVPCTNPPFGTLSAVDLKSKKLLWQVPMGTVEDTGPFDIATHMPMPLGMPTLGGPTSTASGIVFYAGTQDNYLRAMDSQTGKELWKTRLPVGAVAAPLVYVSPETGKQYIVISAGGSSHSKDVGDYIIAFALPSAK